MAAAIAPAPVSIPNTIFDANTGPKGVIADAQAFSRARKSSFRQTFHELSTGLAEKVTFKRGNSRERSHPRSRDGSGSPGSDDEFMERWRKNRMAEMASGKDVRTRRNSPSKRRYGKLTAVDALGYLDAIEKVTADTVVVVLVNDPDSPISNIVEDGLSNLARKHETTRFIKLSYDEAEVDPAGVPTILAYQGGELFCNLTSVIDYIPEGRGLSQMSLETLLKQRQILE